MIVEVVKLLDLCSLYKYIDIIARHGSIVELE